MLLFGKFILKFVWVFGKGGRGGCASGKYDLLGWQLLVEHFIDGAAPFVLILSRLPGT